MRVCHQRDHLAAQPLQPAPLGLRSAACADGSMPRESFVTSTNKGSTASAAPPHIVDSSDAATIARTAADSFTAA